MKRFLGFIFALTLTLGLFATPASAAQTLTWTADDDVTRYKTAPATAVAGVTTVVWENSTATGNTTGMPHTLTFDTSTPGYNHDVTLNILANPFDVNNGRHTATITLTPGRYRYYCTIPGHATMTGELVVTEGEEPPADTTAPVVTATVTGDGTASASVALAATDAGSGVASIEYQLDGGAWTRYTAAVAVTAAGEHTVRYRATDNAGNTSEVGSRTFTVTSAPPGDRTPPTVTTSVAGDGTASATVTVTATDADSGVASVEYQLDGGAWTAYTAPVVVTAAGMHMLHARATDNAGNVSTVAMAHFTVAAPEPSDTTPPTVTATVAGTQDGAGAYVGRATVTLTATDAGSGVRSVEYALGTGAWTAYTSPVVITAPGAHTVRYRATDTAGNVAAVQTVTLTVVAPAPGDCSDSDTRPTVFIDGADTGVRNTVTANGCTVADLIDEDAGYPTHDAFVRHVRTVTAALVAAGTLTHRDAGILVRAAARS